MAMLPARRSGQNLTVLDPSREFEDIYNRTGQLMNLAMGDLGLARLADIPWSPLAEVSETDDAYRIQVELPGVSKDQIDIQLQGREQNGQATPSAKGCLAAPQMRVENTAYIGSARGSITKAEGKSQPLVGTGARRKEVSQANSPHT